MYNEIDLDKIDINTEHKAIFISGFLRLWPFSSPSLPYTFWFALSLTVQVLIWIK